MSDIEKLVGSAKYNTVQILDDGSEIEIFIVSGNIPQLSDSLLNIISRCSYSDDNIRLADGSVISIYGSEDENTIIIINYLSTTWCHGIAYKSIEDYYLGLGLVTPDLNLRA